MLLRTPGRGFWRVRWITLMTISPRWVFLLLRRDNAIRADSDPLPTGHPLPRLCRRSFWSLAERHLPLGAAGDRSHGRYHLHSRCALSHFPSFAPSLTLALSHSCRPHFPLARLGSRGRDSRRLGSLRTRLRRGMGEGASSPRLRGQGERTSSQRHRNRGDVPQLATPRLSRSLAAHHR
jgi:hypothetical protein